MQNYSNSTLHIVSIDIPSPPDYGGVIDIYYKLKHLKALGVKIILHCFEYGRNRDPHLLELCEKVHYYSKKPSLLSFSLYHPYVVYTRKNKSLLANLLATDAPILFEGVHTTYFLHHKALADRRKIVRNHNIETIYFKELGEKTSHFIKKWIYKREGRLMDYAEKHLSSAYGFIPVSTHDYEYFKAIYPKAKHLFAPCFTDLSGLAHLSTGKGKYILYHGNLSHPENHQAATYILENIAGKINFPIIIAGKNPNLALEKMVEQYEHVTLIANPNQSEMAQLIHDAHIHLLITFQATGLKLKLLAALNSGKHIIANNQMLQGSHLEDAVTIANTNKEIINAIHRLKDEAFSAEASASRITLMQQNYDQEKNALAICKMLFDD